ncbi:hypothetical protein BC351_29130 [Paenibacillus ferrarius]|uniref:Uncharacterized protein n=1 Tax=Paenibacillus ferrarius TaxID=1469647 RepID=A0A1V4HI37_9BACL|nr:hypothetical protein [Paenibacillus ferrarius]OPH56232.1 hypothetical protein BC351_29130 [Paenibacillus ferrarius]
MNSFFLEIFEHIEDLERSWLDKPGKYSIHIARLVSLVCMALLVYLLTFFLSIFVSLVLDHFLGINNGNFQYLWSIALLIVFPLSIPLVTNWLDRKFNYSGIFVSFYETLIYSKVDVASFRFFLEIMGFIFYVAINTVITIVSIANFIDEDSLVSYMQLHQTVVISILATIHIVIYFTIRILFLPNKTLEQKLKKHVREFRLWLIVLICTTGYMMYKLFTAFSPIDMAYLIGAILVAIVRLISSYKELRKVIVELKETIATFI